MKRTNLPIHKQGSEAISTIAEAVLGSLHAVVSVPMRYSEAVSTVELKGWLTSAGVLTGLSADQQTACVALVAAQTDLLIRANDAAADRASWRGVVKRGAANLRFFEARLKRVSLAIAQIDRRAKLDGIALPAEFAGAGRLFEAGRLSEKGDIAIATARRSLAALPRILDTRSRIRAAISRFFVTECGLARNEVEVRISKTSEAIWDTRVKTNERYERGKQTNKGSDAIRKSISRQRAAATDTTAKSR